MAAARLLIINNLFRTGLLLAGLSALFMAVGYLVGRGTDMILALAAAAHVAAGAGPWGARRPV
jgi:hypothetical protein